MYLKIQHISLKRTPDDDAFAAEFGRQLRIKYDNAKTDPQEPVTDQVFAASIGVKRHQLGQYLLGAAMPGVRTVVLAFREHGISVPYAEIRLQEAIEGSAPAPAPVATQLVLPFRISSRSAENVILELHPIGPKRYTLNITIGQAG